jgi:hypothetical protein
MQDSCPWCALREQKEQDEEIMRAGEDNRTPVDIPTAPTNEAGSIIDRLRRVFSSEPTRCPQCNCEIDRVTGCGCYYIAVRREVEHRDMIARFDAWQREQL